MNTYFNHTKNFIKIDEKKIYSNKKYNVISLFSGAGGMDLGFRGDFNFLGKHYLKNPFDILFANDIFKQAATVYETNFHNSVERRPIQELDFETDFPDKKIDIVLGGFPCQSFSVAGKRKGLSDPRGQLYLQMIRVIEHYQPKMFVAENVDGIRNSKKNKDGDNVDTTALDTILKDFDMAGYNVQYKVLLAADYGVPQMRRRVIIIGLRKDLGMQLDICYPQATHDETGKITGKKWVTAKDGIDDLWDKVNNPMIPNHTSRDISGAKFYPGKKLQGNNKIRADKPAPTIRAEHHGNIEAHYRTFNEKDPENMKYWRRLSVRECARLQSFPDDFVFNCSASSAYKAVGNAVPPVLAWYIARAIAATLDNLDK